MKPAMTLPCALTIAGSDSGGGAGIQADLRTFAALGVFGASAITAVTAQSTTGVTGFDEVRPALVRGQIDAVLDDLPVAFAKTGMLASRAIIDVVVEALRDRPVALVVDPVMVAKGGASLLAPDAVEAVRSRLLPRALLVTPNLPEAEALVGRSIDDARGQEEAARALVGMGAGAALVKGGHAEGDPVDVLFDGEVVHHLRARRVETRHTHGTGCTYSAAITALLARGRPLEGAVREAHAWLQRAIAEAPGLGHGHGPLHHMHAWYGKDGLDP